MAKSKKVKVGKYLLEELPSKSLRLRKMYQGNTYSIVFESKPTEKEITQALAAEMENVQTKKEQMTFKTAALSYIDLKKNILSPSTIREYTNNIDRLSKNKAPKTVRNYHGFISAILATFRPNLILHTTLPQKRKNEPYIPSDEDVKRILAKVKDTAFEIPVTLACYGLRRSEICALTLDDLDNDVLRINKALVMDSDKKWVIKSTKTTESTRDVIIPSDLADNIRRQGFIYQGHPNHISKKLNIIQDKLGIPRFSIHKLRHYFASKMSELDVPEADIIKMGGWKTDHVMKTVYRHSLQTSDSQRLAAQRFNDALLS